MARFSLIALVGTLSGCAGLETTPPLVSATAVSQERVRLQQDAISTHIERTKYLQDLAWPILQKNADMCGKKIRKVLGWRVLDGKIVGSFTQGLRKSDISSLGWSDEARVALIISGGPAEKAGIKVGDRILKVNDRDVPADLSVAITSRMIAAQIKQLKKGEALRLSVAQPGENPRAVSLVPEVICAFPVDLDRSPAVNAQTNGKKIAMFLGLMRAETEPRRIQFVIAHELAHAMLRHPQKSIRNSLISGGAVLGTVAATAGWLADAASTVAGKRPTVSYQRRGAALATYPYGRDFEREADYVGLYALARAGIDTTGVEDLFTTFARESPSGTWLNLSHPSAPERWLEVRATQAEIDAKRKANLPLLPNGWTARETPHGNTKH